MKTRIIQDEPEGRRTLHAAGGVDAEPGAAGGLRQLVRRHPLVWFFVLSYVVAWGATPFGSFWAFGPLISAVLVVAVAEGWAGLRGLGARMIRWRVGWVWYVVAMAVPLLAQAIAVGTNVAAGAPTPAWSAAGTVSSLALAFATNMLFPLGGQLGEEPGWRGFALPRLPATRSPLMASTVLALLVAGWHLPLAFMPQFDLGAPDIATTAAVTFWYTWLFNRAAGSALLTLLAHATEGTVNIHGLWSGADASRLSWTYLLGWGLVVAALLGFDRGAWRTAPDSAVEPARRADS